MNHSTGCYLGAGITCASILHVCEGDNKSEKDDDEEEGEREGEGREKKKRRRGYYLRRVSDDPVVISKLEQVADCLYAI